MGPGTTPPTTTNKYRHRLLRDQAQGAEKDHEKFKEDMNVEKVEYNENECIKEFKDKVKSYQKDEDIDKSYENIENNEQKNHYQSNWHYMDVML